MSRERGISTKTCVCFCLFIYFLPPPPSPDEILEKQKADEIKPKATEKDSLVSKVNEGSEGDNPAQSVPDLSSPRPESEDGTLVNDKLSADGKASALCPPVPFGVIFMLQVHTCSLMVR